MVLIADIETTGLSGYPKDRVLEIGIAELKEGTGDIIPVYSETVRYTDIMEMDSKYLNPDGSHGIWIYRNTDMRMGDTMNAKKPLDKVVGEVRDIVSGREVVSYNVPFVFGKFLATDPWNLDEICTVPYDIMDMAASIVYGLAYEDGIPDKNLQNRIIRENEKSDHTYRWILSGDAYDVLCPGNPLGLDRRAHGALNDAMMEARILSCVSRTENR